MFSYIFRSLLFRKVSLFETEFDLTEFIHGTCRCLVKVPKFIHLMILFSVFYLISILCWKKNKVLRGCRWSYAPLCPGWSLFVYSNFSHMLMRGKKRKESKILKSRQFFWSYPWQVIFVNKHVNTKLMFLISFSFWCEVLRLERVLVLRSLFLREWYFPVMHCYHKEN